MFKNEPIYFGLLLLSTLFAVEGIPSGIHKTLKRETSLGMEAESESASESEEQEPIKWAGSAKPGEMGIKHGHFVDDAPVFINSHENGDDYDGGSIVLKGIFDKNKPEQHDQQDRPRQEQAPAAERKPISTDTVSGAEVKEEQQPAPSYSFDQSKSLTFTQELRNDVHEQTTEKPQPHNNKVQIRESNPASVDQEVQVCKGTGKKCRKHKECCVGRCNWITMKCDE